MKKSNILLFTSILIVWIFYVFMEPLKGNVFIDKLTGKPRDLFSAMIQKLDKTNEIKYAKLDGINHIKVIGNNENLYTDIYYSDSTSAKASWMGQYKDLHYEKIKDSLIITVQPNERRSLDLNVDPNKSYTLTFVGTTGSLGIAPDDSPTNGVNSIYLKNASKIKLSINSREKITPYSALKLNVDGKSRFEIDNFSTQKLDVKLNNGLLVLEKNTQVDSLNADLQGLSNIIIGKHPEEKRVNSLTLTGNLDYYNQRKPK